MSEELKGCPFCGADAFMWRTNHHVYIQCDKFNASDNHGHMVQVSARTEEEAILKWNDRYYERLIENALELRKLMENRRTE